jgi:hypothetical protein
MIRQIGWIVLCLGLLLMGCQRTVAPEKRVGLNNDSHSYSYVSYPESRMIHAAQTVEQVTKAKVHYNGRNIVMDVYIRPGVKKSEYAKIESLVRKAVTHAAPLNPFILNLHPTDESRT